MCISLTQLRPWSYVIYIFTPFQMASLQLPAPFNPAKFSTTASTLSFPGPVLPTPPVFTESLSTTSVLFPQPLSSVLTTLAQTQSFSMALPLPQPPTPFHSSSPLHSVTSPSTFVNNNLQDLALLDLGSPKKWVVFEPWGKRREGIWISTKLSVYLLHLRCWIFSLFKMLHWLTRAVVETLKGT